MIGEKIKELRKERHMTQAELAGDAITRNMLSQIENGLAAPSLSTLSHVSQKLGVPVEYFVSESDDLDAFLRIADAKKADAAFENGEYEKCLEIIGDTTDSAGTFMRAACLYEIGKTRFENCELLSATEYFDECVKCADAAPFAAPLAEIAKKYITAAEGVLGRNVPSAKPDVLSYVSALNEKDPLAGRHLEVKNLMAQCKYADAQTKLGTLLSDAKSFGPVCEFYILTDLETCLKHTGDFERAYACAERRMELKNMMTK